MSTGCIRRAWPGTLTSSMNWRPSRACDTTQCTPSRRDAPEEWHRYTPFPCSSTASSRGWVRTDARRGSISRSQSRANRRRERVCRDVSRRVATRWSRNPLRPRGLWRFTHTTACSQANQSRRLHRTGLLERRKGSLPRGQCPCRSAFRLRSSLRSTHHPPVGPASRSPPGFGPRPGVPVPG